MSENLDAGALDAGNAIRLAGAMRERAEAQRAADAAREALEAAERRLEGAGRQVEELKAGVTFEDLLELVASLSLRVAELESGGPRPAPAEPPAAAAATASDDAVSGGADDDGEWDRANPARDSDSAPVGHAPPASAAEAPSRAGAEGDDPFADSDSYEGRRGPNRPVLYMNAYARGYADAKAGAPESVSGTKGWEFKGYRDGRKHAAAALGFDPLGAFVEEMRACRTPIEPKVRDQARKLSQILANDHGHRPQDGAPGSAIPVPGAGPAMAEERLDGDEDSEEAVQIPGFLRRSGSEASAG